MVTWRLMEMIFLKECGIDQVGEDVDQHIDQDITIRSSLYSGGGYCSKTFYVKNQEKSYFSWFFVVKKSNYLIGQIPLSQPSVPTSKSDSFNSYLFNSDGMNGFISDTLFAYSSSEIASYGIS